MPGGLEPALGLWDDSLVGTHATAKVGGMNSIMPCPDRPCGFLNLANNTRFHEGLCQAQT